MQSAKRLILPAFLLVAFNCCFNAAHAFEVVSAPTVDPNKVQQEVVEKTDVNFGGIKQEELYEGPGVEVPNLIDVIKEKSNTPDKKDISQITELLKSICAKPEFIKETGKKYNLNETEIQSIIDAVAESKKTIFADAPTALGGIPKKIQYYCYIDENRGHLYNWILNPENKFTKYIFGAFTLSSAVG